MKTFILMTVAVFTLSACAAGSSSTNRTNYQLPSGSSETSKISPHKCYSPELLSLATFTDADRKAVTCRND